MRNIKLTIEFDGTNYHGWQSQNNAVAIQNVVEAAITKQTGEMCRLIGSSRTDTGVHALGLTANFTTESGIPSEKFAYALNRILPEDIVIRESSEVSHDFHARYWAKGKKYKYLILNSQQPSALLRHRAYHVSHKLDFEAMYKATGYFIGEHDFSAFQATGGSVGSTVRCINRIELKHEDNLIFLEISGDGFLYNMVRIIAGTLVYVGLGKIQAEDIPPIISEGDRRKAGKTAPSQGLYLVEVYY